jgi:hypothetical protein
VVVDVGVFCCSTCAGLHREFSHRVKGLSTSIFTQVEVVSLKAKGNEWAQGVWMARYNAREYPQPSVKDTYKIKEFMRAKYVDKRFYSEPSETAPVAPPPPPQVEESKMVAPRAAVSAAPVV